jgi:hypothetical protein
LEDAVSGLAFAKEYSRRIIVEKFIFDLESVIDNKLVAANGPCSRYRRWKNSIKN